MDREALRGIEEITERYDYLDDLKVSLKALIVECDRIGDLLSSWLRSRGSVGFKEKVEAVDALGELEREVGRLAERILGIGDKSAKRAEVERLVKMVREAFRELRGRVEGR